MASTVASSVDTGYPPAVREYVDGKTAQSEDVILKAPAIQDGVMVGREPGETIRLVARNGADMVILPLGDGRRGALGEGA